jgi:glycosyltransferase involved in cell wall biosynthesis
MVSIAPESQIGRHGWPGRRLKIAMVVPPWYELPPRGYGGLESICAALVDGLVDRGHDVTLFGAGERTGTKATFVSTTKTLQFPRLGESMPDMLHVARVNRLIADGDFDVIHDHTAPGPLTAGRLDSPSVVTVHGAVDGELGDYYEAIGEAVRLVAISRSQRAARPNLPWIDTVHNATSLLASTPGDGTGPVMWLARFNPDKGPDLAIEACRKAGLPLTLAGKCNEASEQRYLDSVVTPMVAGSDDVEVILNGEREDVIGRLRSARCLVMPIRWREPFGMVMIEAMALGVPVVALRRGSVPEIVIDGITGFICDDPRDLPAALRRVEHLDRQACIEHVRHHFSPKLMAARYESVYNRAIKERHAMAISGRADGHALKASVLNRTSGRHRLG